VILGPTAFIKFMEFEAAKWGKVIKEGTSRGSRRSEGRWVWAKKLPAAKGPTILASGCAHLFRGFKEDLPSGIITDIPAWLLAFDKLRTKAPLKTYFRHDPLMSTNFPQ
jgi:hypothetical protein